MPENVQPKGISQHVPYYSQPTNDCFIKQTKAVNSVEKTVLSEEQLALQKLYDETYEEHLLEADRYAKKLENGYEVAVIENNETNGLIGHSPPQGQLIF